MRQPYRFAGQRPEIGSYIANTAFNNQADGIKIASQVLGASAEAEAARRQQSADNTSGIIGTIGQIGAQVLPSLFGGGGGSGGSIAPGSVAQANGVTFKPGYYGPAF